MRIFVVGVSLILGGCVFLKDGRRSQWRELDTAKDVSCTPIPLRKDDMAINSLYSLKSSEGEVIFLNGVKKRSGANDFYASSFDGRTLQAASQSPKPLHPQAQVIGGGLRGDKKVLAVVLPQGGEELSDRNGVVRLYREQASPEWSPLPLGKPFEGGRLSLADQGYWLSMRQGNHYQVAYLAEPAGVTGSVASPQWMKSLFRYEPVLIANGEQGGAHAVYLAEKNQKSESPEDFAVIEKDFDQFLTSFAAEEGSKKLASEDSEEASLASEDDASFEFRVRRVGAEGKAGEPAVLELPTAAGVELWTAQGDKQGFTIAYVEGDTLAGQAFLHIAAFAWEGARSKPKWLRSFSLADVHVSDLGWVSGGSVERLIFLKWVDGERTLMSYDLGASGPVARGAQGIFPVNTAIIDSFALRVDGQQEAFAIMRTKDRYLWQFEVCQLGSL